MKKIFPLTILTTILFFLSCQNDDQTRIQEEKSNFTIEYSDKVEALSLLKNNYESIIKTNKQNKGNANYGENFKVNINITDSDNNFFYGSEILNIKSSYEGFEQRNFLINFPYEYNNKASKINLGFINRNFKKGDVEIIEILQSDTGEIINYELFNINEKDYLELRKGKKQILGQRILSKSTPCFTTFEACTQQVSDGDGSPRDAALCDWLPCNTLAYFACKQMAIDGRIESECNFRCSQCGDVVIGEK